MLGKVGVVFTWILVFLAYIMQFLYALRMLELLTPDEVPVLEPPRFLHCAVGGTLKQG